VRELLLTHAKALSALARDLGPSDVGHLALDASEALTTLVGHDLHGAGECSCGQVDPGHLAFVRASYDDVN
jgi:hypothetical protein